MLLTLELWAPELYDLEALPFTYGQYFVIELADKLYNSVTIWFCVSPWIFIQINNFFQVAGAGVWTADAWITKPLYLYTTHWTHHSFAYFKFHIVSAQYQRIRTDQTSSHAVL